MNNLNNKTSSPFTLDLGAEHITIQRRYEAAGACNDFLIAIWFLIGSLFFLSPTLVQDGTWLFVLGSAQLMIKPILKLASLIHVAKSFNRMKNNK